MMARTISREEAEQLSGADEKGRPDAEPTSATKIRSDAREEALRHGLTLTIRVFGRSLELSEYFFKMLNDQRAVMDILATSEAAEGWQDGESGAQYVQRIIGIGRSREKLLREREERIRQLHVMNDRLREELRAKTAEHQNLLDEYESICVAAQENERQLTRERAAFRKTAVELARLKGDRRWIGKEELDACYGDPLTPNMECRACSHRWHAPSDEKVSLRCPSCGDPRINPWPINRADGVTAESEAMDLSRGVHDRSGRREMPDPQLALLLAVARASIAPGGNEFERAQSAVKAALKPFGGQP